MTPRCLVCEGEIEGGSEFPVCSLCRTNDEFISRISGKPGAIGKNPLRVRISPLILRGKNLFRDQMIFSCFHWGMSYAEIARRSDLSRERVRQICLELVGRKIVSRIRKQHRARGKEVRDFLARERRIEKAKGQADRDGRLLARTFRIRSLSDLGFSSSGIARRLGISRLSVHRHLYGTLAVHRRNGVPPHDNELIRKNAWRKGIRKKARKKTQGEAKARSR